MEGKREEHTRQVSATDGGDGVDWRTSVFRYTSKLNREVLGFIKIFLEVGLAGGL